MICTNNIIPLIFKARIWPLEVRADILAVLLKSSFGRVGWGRPSPITMNFENLFEFFRTHTASWEKWVNSAKFASQYCPEIRNFYLLKLAKMRA